MQLYLYRGVTPNTPSSVSYIYETYENYINAFQNYLVKTFELNNYRINNNVLKVSSEGIEDLTDELTYVIVYDADKGYFKAYHINSVMLQSGMMIISLSVDYWATFNSRFNSREILVNKCNRNIGTGIYDDIEAVNGSREINRLYTDLAGGYINNDNVGIVIQVEFNASQNVANNDRISMTQLFALDIASIKSEFSTNDDALLVARDYVGGIYGVTAGVLGFATNDAKVIKAWVVDYRQIDVGLGGARTQIEFHSKCRYSSGNEKKIKFYYCLPSIKTVSVLIPDTLYDINKKFVMGTYNDGINVTRFTSEELTINYTYIIDDSVKVIVSQGDNEKDITNGFELELTTNSLVETSLRRLAKAVSKTASASSQILKPLEEGNLLNAGISGASTLASLVGSFGVSSAVGGGNGLTTFFTKRGALLGACYSPYVLTTWASINNEMDRLEYNGANFNKIIGGLDILKTIPPIKDEYSRYYIKGSFVNRLITASTEATNEINSMIENGVYLIYVE